MRQWRGRTLPDGKQASWSAKRQNFPDVPVQCLHVLYDEPTIPDPRPPPAPLAASPQDVSVSTPSSQDTTVSSQDKTVSTQDVAASSQDVTVSSQDETVSSQEVTGKAQPMAPPERRPGGLLYGTEPDDGNLSYLPHVSPPVSQASELDTASDTSEMSPASLAE